MKRSELLTKEQAELLLSLGGEVQGIAEGLSSGLKTLADEIVRLRKENEELRKKLASGTGQGVAS